MKLVIGFLLALVAMGWLTGCATLGTDAPSVTRTVTLPCVRATDIPVRGELLAEFTWQNPTATVFDKVKALKIDRIRLIAHADKLESTLRACVGEP